MRNIVVVGLGLAVLVVAGLLIAGVIPLASGPEADGDVPVPPPPVEEGAPAEEEGAALGPRTPETQPPLESFPLEDEVAVLLLVGAPERFNATLAGFWQRDRQIRLLSWSAPPPDTAGSGPPPGDVLPGHWEGPLTADTLGEKAIDVVIVHDLDPADVPDPFWDALYEQVRDGDVGFMVIAGLLNGGKMLDHVGFRRMIPVKRARPIEGPELPGVFRQPVPFAITEAGSKHPATRLVQWPSWSRRIWSSRGEGETPWATPFCYPVEEVSDGAVVLLRVDPRAGETYPAIVQGPARVGRVLWLGMRELGPDASYRSPEVVGEWRTLAANWIVWLAGRAPE